MKTVLASLFVVNATILCIALWKALSSDDGSIAMAASDVPMNDKPASLLLERKADRLEKEVDLPKESAKNTTKAVEVIAQEPNTNTNEEVIPEEEELSYVSAPDEPLAQKTVPTVTQKADDLLSPQSVVERVAETPEPITRESIDHCWTLGAFTDHSLAGKVKEALSSRTNRSDDIQVIDHSVEDIKNYWVFLPPFESKRAAYEVNRQLKQKSIDNFVVTKGDRKNSISLGVFNSEARAKRLQANLLKKNVEAQIKANKVTRPEYWLEVRGIPEVDWPQIEPSVTPIFTASQKKSQKMIQKPCKAVASFS